MKRLRTMITRFANNLKSTEFYDKSFWYWIFIIAIIITILCYMMPNIYEVILFISMSITIVGLPITLIAIYDGMFNKDNDSTY